MRLPGSEACVAGDALARVVERKLRRSVFPAARDASILIEGHVAKTADGYAAELHMTDEKHEQLGSRTLSSSDASCRELSETLGVVLAVMIDPDAAKRPPSALPAPQAPKTEQPKRAAPDDNRGLAFARVLVGITKTPLIGFGAAYERALGAAGGLRIEAAFFLENDTSFDIPNRDDDAHALVDVSYLGLAYCPLWLKFSSLRLAGCAGAELGLARGHGNKFPLPAASDPAEMQDQYWREAKALWASGSASLRLSIVLAGPFEAHLAGGLLGTFGQGLVAGLTADERVDVLPANKAHLGGAFDLGLGARF